MGKVALLAIGAFVIMSAYYGMGTRTQLLAADEQIAQHDYQVVLRNAAMSGFNRAKQELVQSFTGTSFSGPFEDANYNTSVMANPVTKIADVTSTGWMYDPSGKLLQYQIIAKIRLLETTSTDTTVVLPAAPPKFMQYALITEENLTLNGNVDVEAVPIEIEGKESAAYNANIHTNGDMTVNGRVTVRGFGTYRGTNLINPNDPHRFFKPYDNSSGDDVLKRLTEDVEIPLASMNPDSLNAKFPPDVQTVGDTTLDGNLNFKAMASPGDGAGRGTREHPYILYVNGDLTLNGDVEMDGYGIILVKDDVILNGNVSIQTGQGPTESTFGLYACGNITLNGTVDVLWGQVFAKGNFIMNGTPQINGNVVVGGLATLNGTPNINYYPSSPGLTQYWQTPDDPTEVMVSLELMNYVERDLTDIGV